MPAEGWLEKENTGPGFRVTVPVDVLRDEGAQVDRAAEQVDVALAHQSDIAAGRQREDRAPRASELVVKRSKGNGKRIKRARATTLNCEDEGGAGDAG